MKITAREILVALAEFLGALVVIGLPLLFLLVLADGAGR